MLLPFMLIMKEPDLGSALVLLPTGLAMMFVAGTPRRYLLRLHRRRWACWPRCFWWMSFSPRPAGRSDFAGTYQRNRLLVYFGRDYTHFAPPNATAAELQTPAQAAVR